MDFADSRSATIQKKELKVPVSLDVATLVLG
jgi:hypothetical protein